MQWLRWYHGTYTDPKWRVVARRTGQPEAIVIAVWAAVLEHASDGIESGLIEGWDPEDVAAALGLEADVVEAVVEGMQGKVLEGERVKAWDKRQPKRNDDSRERVRRHREKKKGEVTDGNDGETPGNADVTHVTQGNAPEESRGEESNNPPIGPPEGGESNRDQVREVFDHWVEVSGRDGRTKLTEDRARKIRARLRTFTVDQLKQAIEAGCQSAFHRGENERGQRYDHPETLLKNDSSVEKWLEPPPPNGSHPPPNSTTDWVKDLPDPDEMARQQAEAARAEGVEGW